MRALINHCLAVPRNLRLLGLHLIGNAVLLISASLWLLVPEQHAWQLLFAAVSALLLIFLFLWLHAATLIFAADPVPEKLLPAFRVRLGQLGWLLLGLVVLFASMWFVSGWSDSVARIAGYAYSITPASLRPVHGGTAYFEIGEFLLAVVVWYVLPGLLLPLTAALVLGKGLVQGLHALRRKNHWLLFGLLALAGIWLPELILDWKPGSSLTQEMTSLGIRLVIAYLIATLAWLATAGLLGYGWEKTRVVGHEPNADGGNTS